VHDVAARHVEVDPVEPGLLGALGGIDVLLGDLLYLGDAERSRYITVEVARLGDIDWGSGDGRPLIGGRMVVEQGVLPRSVVLHLHEGRAPVTVDQVDELLHPRDVLVVVHPIAEVPATPLRIVQGRSLDRDDPHPSAGQGIVETERVLVHLEFGLMEGMHARGRLVDAVARLDFADLPRLEQLGVLRGVAHITVFLCAAFVTQARTPLSPSGSRASSDTVRPVS